MAQAEGCFCMWCLADSAGAVPFSSVYFALCISIFTIDRAEMFLFLTGKPSLAA